MLMRLQWFVSRPGKVTELFRNPCCLADVGGQELCEAESLLAPNWLDPPLKVSDAASPCHCQILPLGVSGSFWRWKNSSTRQKIWDPPWRDQVIGERVQPGGGSSFIWRSACNHKRNPLTQTSLLQDNIILVRHLPPSLSPTVQAKQIDLSKWRQQRPPLVETQLSVYVISVRKGGGAMEGIKLHRAFD